MEKIFFVELGSNKGIAGEFDLRNLDEVLSLTPFSRYFEGQAGSSVDRLRVIATIEDGEEFTLSEAWEQAHASNYDPTTSSDAPTIGEQIAGREVVRQVFDRLDRADWREESKYSETLLLIQPDWTKVRRRVEDALRKTTDHVSLYRLAVELGVKIY